MNTIGRWQCFQKTLKDEKFSVTFNEDLCKTADGNSFKLLNNLIEKNLLVYSDMALIRKLTSKILDKNMD
ncbi:hypothetical protein MXB_3343, partial [Myxobolus squamalis]